MMRLALLIAITACSPMTYTHGIPNFAQVGPGVYRSGQITSTEGRDYLVQIAAGRKIRIVKLNYANEGSDELLALAGAVVYEMPIQPEGDQDLLDDLHSVWLGPAASTVRQIDALLLGARPDELWLVHCTHGQDRTGYVVGRYRVLHDHWAKAKAYEEMVAHDFHAELHGIHEAWEAFRP
jgi:hypothetical protein